MEVIIPCLCSLLCFICGVWAAHGLPKRRADKQEVWTQEDDALSRDIAAMLAYTGPNKEDTDHDA